MTTWDPEEFVACSRYGELDEMINIMCKTLQVSDLSTIPAQEMISLIKTRNSQSQSALHLSAANGHLNIVEFLVKYLTPKDINAMTEEGSTPLHWAALNGHFTVVEKLLEAGADATIRNAAGRSPVTLAEQQSHLDVVQALLKSYDPEEEEDEGLQNYDENGNEINLENE